MRVLNLLATLALAGVVAAQGSGSTADLGSLVERVNSLENAAIPQAMAHAQTVAYATAFNASMTTSATLNQQVTNLASAIDIVQNNVESMVSQAVAEALESQMAVLDSAMDQIGSPFGQAERQIGSALSTAENAVGTAENNTGLIIGWKECATTRSDGMAQREKTFMDCGYVKKRDDTILSLAISTNFRQINGNSYYRFYVSGHRCEGPDGQSVGDIQTAFHGSRSINNHRPMYFKSFCWSLADDSNTRIPAGFHHIEWTQYSVSADSDIGWSSTSRIRIEEWIAKDDNSQFTLAGGNDV